MDLATFLTKQKDLMEDILICFEKEKQALIKDDAQSLLETIEEKKHLINTLDNLEEKRLEVFPNTNISQLEEKGLLDNQLKLIIKDLRELAEEINQLKETNQALTHQSLEYTQRMISIIRGNNKHENPSYGANGKIENNKKNSVLDQSI